MERGSDGAGRQAMRRVVAIMGSYRRGGVTDTAVDAVLEGARGAGAETSKIYLIDQHIEFCRNCRACTQEGGMARGRCVIEDDVDWVLRQVESADALVLAASVNYYNATAIFRQFLERMIGYMYWPWGCRVGPLLRTKVKTKRAVLVSSSAMPAWLIPLITGAPRALRMAAKMAGARTVGTLWVGTAGIEAEETLPMRTRERAMALGRRLS